MRIINSVGVTTGALAVVLSLSAAAPAEAGKACNRIGLGSPCVNSSDLKARLNLDEDGRDARLRLRNAAGANAVELDAGSASVTNLFSNDEDASNGLVKAWARINVDGTIIACWRCNRSPLETQKLDIGEYEGDFTPLATDITGRPRLATIHGFNGEIALFDRVADASSVVVSTSDPGGVPTDLPFVLIIF